MEDKLEYHSGAIEKISTSPSIHDSIARHRLVYLNGPGGSGKTTRVINLFRGANLMYTEIMIDEFDNVWKPYDMIVSSKTIIRDVLIKI